MNLEGKWKAILIGSLITGLAPLVPLLNLACCLIPFAGALVAVAIYCNETPRTSVSNSDGVVLGVMTGLIGSVIHAVIIILVVFFLGNFIGGFLGHLLPGQADLPARLEPFMHGILANFGGILLFAAIFRVLSYLGLSLVFGILGGIVGVALFKRTANP